MMSLPFGIILMVAVLGLALAGQSALILANTHSLILVVIGTFAVLVLAAPTQALKLLFAQLAELVRPGASREKIRADLLALSRKREAVLQNPHPLIAYAQELWEQGIDPEFFRMLLAHRMEEMSSSSEQATSTLRNLAKYPPALGMTGTVVGLISLFSNLTPDAKDKIGPSLAMAMTATFYGLILSNAVIMPLADRMAVSRSSDLKNAEHVFQVLLLINAGEPASMIEGEDHARAA